ncbi:hypothetical protein ACFSHQ_04230 [Gemmobacter lanyuensis]
MNQSPILTPMAGDPAWRAVVQRTERLRALIDVPNRDLTADLPDIRAELVLLRGPLREFALEALSRLVDAATARRETLARLWLRSATLAVTLIVMLLVLSWGCCTLRGACASATMRWSARSRTWSRLWPRRWTG